MSYCAIEEAFAPLVPGGATSKKQKKMRSVIVPSAPAGSDAEVVATSMSEPTPKAPVDPDRPAERPEPSNDVLTSRGQGQGQSSRLEAAGSSDFFPMQSDNEPEAWQKAFLLNDIQVPKPTFSVQGKPTLWRSIPKPVAAATGDSFSSAASSTFSSVIVNPLGHGPSELAPIPDEISRRLDSLTRQLDSLVTPTPMQGTAELFLFVAIGLLLLLAIDTLLRYATATATSLRSFSGSGSGSTGLHVLAGGRRLASSRYR